MTKSSQRLLTEKTKQAEWSHSDNGRRFQNPKVNLSSANFIYTLRGWMSKDAGPHSGREKSKKALSRQPRTWQEKESGMPNKCPSSTEALKLKCWLLDFGDSLFLKASASESLNKMYMSCHSWLKYLVLPWIRL